MNASADEHPTLRDASRVWGKIGVLSFGGPAAQIALMHKEVVEDRNWLTERQFLNALSFCMLLPGPEAMQLSTYAGWRLHGVLGGLVAGLAFVLPGALLIMALAVVYALYGDVPLVEALFYGIKAAVLVIVVQALLRLARRALARRLHVAIAAAAFVAIFFFSVPFPVIVLCAALLGAGIGASQQDARAVDMAHVSASGTLATILIWLAIWLVPLGALTALGAPDLLVDVGRFFATLAVVTFGGAYAVLAYMAQDAVVEFGWLSAGEMVDALGLAETTPGPLILVTQFVGFLAGFREGGLPLGIAAAAVTLWVTFAPCFLWIFAGAPYIEWISNQRRLKGALEAITAAVVGVILNLSIWFALHVLFATVSRQEVGPLTLWTPQLASIEWPALGLFLLSAILAFGLRWGIVSVLVSASLAGAALRLVL